MSAQRLTHMKHTGQWQVFLCPLLRICKLVHPSSYLESYEYTQHIIQLNFTVIIFKELSTIPVWSLNLKKFFDDQG